MPKGYRAEVVRKLAKREPVGYGEARSKGHAGGGGDVSERELRWSGTGTHLLYTWPASSIIIYTAHQASDRLPVS